jgi:Uma2 family endonuclease
MSPAQGSRAIHRYTYAAYLDHEEGANTRHEYWRGEIYAMAGGSRQHAALAMNVGAALHAELRDQPCVVYSSDLKVRAAEADLASYPDVTVICGPAEEDPASRHVVLNPTLVVEVTSPSTEDWDRGDKLEGYKTIASLQAVLLVSHRERRVDVVERSDEGRWAARAVTRGSITLAQPRCTLAVEDVYRNVEL